MTFTPTWLYVKQHRQTGLMYFGKTCRDPQKYLGSGLHWTRHLKKYGKDIETLWCERFDDMDSLVEFATFFSEYHDIVESDQWANMKPENGLDGTPYGTKLSEETRKKISQNHWAKGLLGETNPHFGKTRSECTKLNISFAKQGKPSGTLGTKRSQETKDLFSEQRKGKFPAPQKFESKVNEYIQVLKIYEQRPDLEFQLVAKNGRTLTYERAFAKAYCADFGLTVNGLYAIITGKNAIIYDEAVSRLKDQKLVKNDRFEIWTPSGWQDFDGITKKNSTTVELTFEDGRRLECTPDHQILIGDEFVPALAAPATITRTGSKSVYDPINVGGGNVYYTNGIVSHNCVFLGSSATLIDGEKIGTIPHITPLGTPIPFLNQFVLPQEKHSYVITVDVSRGVDLDYSTFAVIDISVNPYVVAAVYRNNMISTLVYPEVIFKVAKWYNNAYVLVETNDLGQQVADILFYDLEYENMYMSTHDTIKEGGDTKLIPGLKTTKKSKIIGCDNLKNLIESDNLVVNDIAIINEMSTFARKGTSFAAEEGKNDDLMMMLVIFGYLTGQMIFKDLFDENLREKFVADQIREVESQFLPIGFFDNGYGTPELDDEDDESKPFAAVLRSEKKNNNGESKSSWDLVWTAVEM